MKTSNQIWSALTIFGKENHRDIFTAHIEDYMLGCEHGVESSTLYFNKDDITQVNLMLNNLEYINNWHWSEVEEENWNKKCTDFFKPIIIDERIEIIPYWENSRSQYLSIKINPALAFGTGHHETTYMMIEAMLDFDFKNKSVLDIGTGSGILSILSKQLGSNHILAIDNDHLTENNFIENLEFNHINDVEFKIADCTSFIDYNFDFMCAKRCLVLFFLTVT